MGAVPVDVHGSSSVQQIRGPLVLVACAFDASAEADVVVAAAAGVEPSECLTVSVGDVVEVIGQGEAWLYGKRREGDGNWTFGFVPETHITRSPVCCLPEYPG